MKQCYMAMTLSVKELIHIIEKGLEIIADNPESIRTFKEVDEEYISNFLFSVWRHDKGFEDYHLVGFRDSEDHHIVGAVLLSIGSPWYNSKLTCLNEECTVAFEKGYGITRVLAKYFVEALKNPDCEYDVVQASSANDYVAKLIENTYTKFGFKQYKSYYKCR